MDARAKAYRPFPDKLEIRCGLEQLQTMLRRTAAVIASCREAQARRRIQLYYDDRLIDELSKAGNSIGPQKK